MSTLYPNVRVNVRTQSGALLAGRIVHRNADGSYSVQWDNGQIVPSIARAHLLLATGTRVHARLRGGNHYPATIIEAQNNGTHYSVAFDLGVEEPKQPVQDIYVDDPAHAGVDTTFKQAPINAQDVFHEPQPQPPRRQWSAASHRSPMQNQQPVVQQQQPPYSTPRPNQQQPVYASPVPLVQQPATNVTQQHQPAPVYAVRVSSTSAAVSRHPVGARVQAKWKGGRSYPGKIRSFNADGTYVVDFDDGTSEAREPADHITVLGSQPASSVGGTGYSAAPVSAATYRVGEQVSAQWSNGEYYPATIVAVNPDGTYGILYSDGVSGRVPAHQINRPSSVPGGSAAAGFHVGQRVQARWKGGSFYSGAINAVNADGTYVVRFDDGYVEQREPATDITVASSTAAGAQPVVAGFQIGQRVSAKWKGGSYYSGSITAVNGDGTYAVRFDDGDFEPFEPASHINSAGGGGGGGFQVGQRVSARWKGGSHYNGVISAVNGNGTYAVSFDDGDYEPSEPAGDIVVSTVPRSTYAAAPVVSTPTYSSGTISGGGMSVGSRVNARWKGGSFYPGVISAVNGDGTYGIAFDDGCHESREPAGDIAIPVGTRVSCSWRSIGFYPGVIGAVNNDGTYQVNFDDGDVEYYAARSDIKFA